MKKNQIRSARKKAIGKTIRPQKIISPSNENSRFPIVGIGTSAGGLEALQLFFKGLSPTTGMGFVNCTTP